MASRQDDSVSQNREKNAPVPPVIQPRYLNNIAVRRTQKLPFSSVLLPAIALATFGQIASFDRLSSHFPEYATLEMRGPAVPAQPVFSQILPPLTAPAKTGVNALQVLTVSRGDTLQSLLTELGASWDEAEQAVLAIRKFFDPRDLHVGQQLSVTLTQNQAGAQIKDLALEADADRMVVAKRQADGGFSGQQIMRTLTKSPHMASGKIESSLFEAAQAADVPTEVVVELIRLFSYDTDFQRDVQPNDGFEVLYDQEMNESGEMVRTGAIRYAALILGNQRKELIRFTPSDDGIADYFDRNGHSAQKALIKTPVDGAKLSSRFGMRKHPILGYTRMHKGLDFATATGTPVMAAGQGFVEMAGWNGAYGKYVRIRHNDGYSTAYAHLSGFGKGIRKGMRVRQGQTIGFTGSTGRSTGPHLHYEILVNGEQVNPQTVKMPTSRALSGNSLAEFKKLRRDLDKERAQLRQTPLKTADL